jgi:hypothetical protein
MKKLTLKEIEKMPVINQGQFDNVIFNDGKIKICISRCTIADGMNYNNEVTEEHYINNDWVVFRQYEAK